jgi:uncharacterized protein (DUF433 family)
MKTKTFSPQENGRTPLDADLASLPDDDEIERLIQAYVRPDPHRAGVDRARVVADGRGAPVWAVIGDLRGGQGLAATADGYDLPREAVVAALGYYRRHRSIIDHRLAINDGTLRPVG